MAHDSVVPLSRFLIRRFGTIRAGWIALHCRLIGQRLDRLATHLQFHTRSQETPMHDLKITAPEGQPVIIMTRTFNAPRELVWKAISEPEHAVRWWGPHGHKNKVLKWDWRVGGEWSIESTMPEGTIVFFGEYREIQKPEKVTQTFSFDQLPPGAHSVDTVILEDHGDKTVYRATSLAPDLAARDAMLASGMEVGVVEGFERLDTMLDEWKAKAV
jgi:uncharacterized protein YndB with AHSA1/START domain